MNLAETNQLLTLIASYDNRRTGDETVRAWREVLADLPFADCRAAVVEHFANSEAYLMPVHVRQGALARDRDRRREQREEQDRLAIEAEASDPTRRDRSPEVRALLDELRRRLPPVDETKIRRVEWVENDKRREREERAEPNPAFVGPPPADGWPLPDEGDTT